MQLHQYLSKTGIFSSKKGLLTIIQEGKIKVGNTIITNQAHYFDPKKKHVYYQGKQLKLLPTKLYLIINKPVGYLSSKLTANDIQLKKKSVFMLLGKEIRDEIKKTLFCVGRLDEDSSGLLILTNDGKLNLFITDPNNKIKKTYSLTLEKPITNKEIQQLEQGITIQLEENGKITPYTTKQSTITLLTTTTLEITITEGKKREIRRMFTALNNTVLTLERTAIGNVRLDLPSGAYKKIDKAFLTQRL